MILGYVEYAGTVYPYVEKDENGYKIMDEPNHFDWVGYRQCKEVEEPKKEPLNDFEKAVYSICIDLAQTLIKKNRDYGESFKKIYDEYGDLSTLIRLTDKLERFKTLQSQENLVKDESKDDTLLDIMGYSCLTLAIKQVKK